MSARKPSVEDLDNMASNAVQSDNLDQQNQNENGNSSLESFRQRSQYICYLYISNMNVMYVVRNAKEITTCWSICATVGIFDIDYECVVKDRGTRPNENGELMPM